MTFNARKKDEISQHFFLRWLFIDRWRSSIILFSRFVIIFEFNLDVRAQNVNNHQNITCKLSTINLHQCSLQCKRLHKSSHDTTNGIYKTSAFNGHGHISSHGHISFRQHWQNRDVCWSENEQRTSTKTEFIYEKDYFLTINLKNIITSKRVLNREKLLSPYKILWLQMKQIISICLGFFCPVSRLLAFFIVNKNSK